MSSSPTFSYDVPTAWHGLPWGTSSFPFRWLAVDGTETTRDDDRLRLTFRVWPKGSDMIRVQRRLDELNGGLAQTVDLDRTIRGLWLSIRTRIEAQLWPGPAGRPRPTSSAEAEAQERAVEEVFAGDREKLAMDRLQELVARQRMLAEWEVLIVAPPAGWESLAERVLSSDVLDAILLAHQVARANRETELGKVPPSAR